MRGEREGRRGKESGLDVEGEMEENGKQELVRPRGSQSVLSPCNLDSKGPLEFPARPCLSLGRPDTRVLCQ